MNELQALHALAEHEGVLLGYTDYQGRRVEASPEVLMMVLRELGCTLNSVGDAPAALAAAQAREAKQLVPPCVVAWDGVAAAIDLRPGARTAATVSWELQLESGARTVGHAKLDDLRERASAAGHREFELVIPVGELGYHRIELNLGGERASVHVLAAPQVAFDPPKPETRRWGVFAPIHAIHSERTCAIADLGDLGRVSRFTKALGGSYVGTLPLLPCFLGERPYDASPYSPVSRLAWNELYLDLDTAPGANDCADALLLRRSDSFRQEAAALRREPLIDYRRAFALRWQIIELLAEHAMKTPALRTAVEAFAAQRPEMLEYARFRAVTDAQRKAWPEWPERLRGGTVSAADANPRVVNTYLYAQWVLDRQMADLAAQGASLYLDLPVGVSRDGFDVWRERDAFVDGVGAGAPPDALFVGGQDWGLPPLHPRKIRERGYRYFAACVAHHARHAGMLRVDHVMGMHRLYWVPRGIPATDGVYVRYPVEELYAVLCLESHRNRCAIAGEDLGTVPPDVHPMMRAHGFSGLYVGQFSVPWHAGAPILMAAPETIASLNTHDTPTFAGFWAGRDIDTMHDLGFLDDDKVEGERGARASMRRATSRALGFPSQNGDDADVGQVMRTIVSRLAEMPAHTVLVNLEDLWLETEPQNVPGTSTERPNWRLKMDFSLEHIEQDAPVVNVLKALASTRG